MGGLAVAVDWQQPVNPGIVESMLAMAPYRAQAGSRAVAVGTAVVGEARMSAEDGWSIAIDGNLAIVGDLRLWNTTRLRSVAGGASATRGMGDRRLLLAAYRRAGIDFLDAVDGDYAFVIWDSEQRVAVGVRDRFSVKPLFYQRLPTGIRFASEPKQLVAVSPDGPVADELAVAEYLTGSFSETQSTFFEGVRRVRPAHVLVATEHTLSERHYWDVSQAADSLQDTDDIPGQFRETLVNSVRRRLATSDGAIGQLSGGLDSPSVAASAQILSSRNELPVSFDTASALYPGHSNDETPWIREIAETQSFPHHEFVPRVRGIDRFDEDMWSSGQPWIDRDRDLWFRTTEIAHDVGADLILTGHGGDHVLDQTHLLSSYLGGRQFGRWASAVRSTSRLHGVPIVAVAARSIRSSPPTWVRTVRGRYRRSSPAIAHPELAHKLEYGGRLAVREDWELTSRVYTELLAETQRPMLSWINESQEAEHASAGVGISHPYFDREVYEFALSIPLRLYPFDGRSKSLVRQAFHRYLPASVIDRSSVSVADEYLRSAFAIHAPQYVARYPRVTEAALPYADASTYRTLVQTLDRAGAVNAVSESLLWRAWTVMAWLDLFHRFRS